MSSNRCFPLLYINMSGEMIYILEQRLKHVANDKSTLVLRDIIGMIFDKKHLSEVFRPQELPHRAQLRNTFEKLAHSSIMRLNDSSMDKLFDLMTMTSKYQIQSLVYPEQVLTVAVNHLVGIRVIVEGDKDMLKLIDNAHAMLMSLYRPVQPWEFFYIKNCLLTYYMDSKVKVSLMIRENRQLEDGRFIIMDDSEPIMMANYQQEPGRVIYYDPPTGEITKTVEWPPQEGEKTITYETLKYTDTYNMDDDERTTLLGCNMYKGGVNNMKIKGGGGTGKAEPLPEGDEMKLLESLFGGSKLEKDTGDLMDLSMFDDVAEEKKYMKETAQLMGNVKKIDASKKKNLSSAMEEMEKGEQPVKAKKAKGADILDLLDEAAARPPTAKKAGGSVKARPISKDSKAPAKGAASTRERSASVKARTPSAGSRPTSSKPAAPSRTPSATRKKTATKN